MIESIGEIIPPDSETLAARDAARAAYANGLLKVVVRVQRGTGDEIEIVVPQSQIYLEPAGDAPDGQSVRRRREQIEAVGTLIGRFLMQALGCGYEELRAEMALQIEEARSRAPAE